MKITLVKPPAYSVGLMGAQLVPFLGIMYLGAVARRSGHQVDIIDMCAEDITRTEIVRQRYVRYGMSLDDLTRRLRPTDVFLVTAMFSQDWVFHRELIQFLKQRCPDSIIAAGGEHLSALPEYCLQDCPELDVCVLGEGEDTLTKLLAALDQQKPLSTVNGIVYRNQAGAPMRTAPAERIRDLESLPLPAWDLIPLENYLSRGLTYHVPRGRTMPMLLSRGCPYQCTFCSNKNMWGNRWIARDPKKVVDEIELYIRQYSANNFVFSDLTAVIDRDKVVQFCQEILNRNLNITWQSPSLRTEVLDADVLQLMYESGCRDLDFAIESGSPDVLKEVGKKNDPRRMASLIRDGVRVGVNMSANMVIGLPGESRRDLFKTFGLALRLAVAGMHEINVFPFIPYPGSSLFEKLLKEKIITLNDEYFLGLFAYGDLSRPVSWNPHFGPRTLSALRLLMMSSFYLVMWLSHPIRLCRMIGNAFQGKTTTKFEGVMKRVFRNVGVSMSRGAHVP